MSERVTVTTGELRQGIEIALATDFPTTRESLTEVFKNVKAGEEGYSPSGAIFLAAAAKFHSLGFSEVEILNVFQRGLEELGVPVG